MIEHGRSIRTPGEKTGAGEAREEKKIYTYEEALRMVNTRNSFPKNADKLFGPKNLKTLQELLYDSTIQDIDICELCGYLDEEAAIEYIQYLEEHHVFRVALTDLAYRIVDHLKPKTDTISIEHSIPMAFSKEEIT